MTLKELKEELLSDMEIYPILKKFYEEDWIKEILNYPSDLDGLSIYCEWMPIGLDMKRGMVNRMIDFCFLDVVSLKEILEARKEK